MNGERAQPLALLLGSVAYLYSSLTNVVNMRPMSNSTLVETNYGILRGTKDVSRGGNSFYEYLGVPYAKPPLGDLRFEPPLPPDNWTGIRDATRYGSRCWQYEWVTRSVVGDENCLFCNIFTSKIQHPNEDNNIIEPLLPVIVYIHGGLFMAGSSNLYRPKYFMDEDIVLVTLNYRLASFGFLNTGDEVVRGNMGLKDQAMALKWVHENIKVFGGDPHRVTIVGQSAGAASVHLHMLSPMSKGLFQQAISQSGSALSPWALVNKPKEQSQLLGRRMNCPTVTSKGMVDCLKSKSARQIARNHIGYIKLALNERESVYGPTIESQNDSSTFLSRHPRELLQEGQISRVPWINGVTSEEGLVYMIRLIRNESSRTMINNEWKRYAPILFNYEGHPNKDNISYLIRNYYLGDKTIGVNTMKESVNMFSDRGFFEDSRDSAIIQSQFSPVYSYFYTYEGEIGMANIAFARTSLPLPETLDFAVGSTLSWFSSNVLRVRERNHYGVCHSDEINMLFNIPILAREIVPGGRDYYLSRAFVGLWANFAKYGFPDTSGLFYGVTWNAIDYNVSDSKPLQRLRITENADMIEEPFFERVQFWKSLNLSQDLNDYYI